MADPSAAGSWRVVVGALPVAPTQKRPGIRNSMVRKLKNALILGEIENY